MSIDERVVERGKTFVMRPGFALRVTMDDISVVPTRDKEGRAYDFPISGKSGKDLAIVAYRRLNGETVEIPGKVSLEYVAKAAGYNLN